MLNVYGTNWTDTGPLQASNGGELVLNGPWTSIASISITANGGGEVVLAGTYSVDAGASIGGSGGTVYFAGTVNSTGITLALTSASLTYILDGGAIDGGTVAMTNGATLVGSYNGGNGGTLAGVTLDGNLDLATTNGANVTVTGGLTLNGTIDLGNASGSTYGRLNFVGAQTFTGSGSVLFGGAGSSSDQVTTAASNGDSGTLTIGAGITIHGKAGSIGNSSLPLINQGTIADDVSGGVLNVYGTNWTNSGPLEASGGGELVLTGTWTNSGLVQALGGGTLSASTPVNLSAGTLSGGNWLVGANSTLSLGANISELAANITLQGSAATFTGLSHLATISSAGEFQLQGGASFTTPGSLDNAGTVNLAAGTLNVTGNYTQESTGTYDVGIGGIAAGGQFGQLNVSQSASLNGGLDVSLINSYTPPQGDSYAVLTFASESGNFAAEFGLYFGSGEGFNPTFSPSTNPTAVDLVVIAEAAGTQTTVQSSENPSNYGDTVTFTATVTPTVSTNLTPTGTVTFFDGVSDLGSATLVNGSATFATATIAGGSSPIVVEYNGDSNFSGSDSSPLTQTVNPIASQTALQSSENPSFYTESVTFTATVSSSSSTPGLATPSGQVEFFDGSTLLDTATLSGGTVSFTTTALGVGANQQIEGSYLGDANYNPSNITITQTVTAPSLATLDGEVYNDPNNSGTPVSGAGLSGWTVTLLSGPTPVATTTTDSNGDYSFTNVFPGSYTISVSELSGYAPTVPASGSLAVTATAGQTVSNLDFGEFQTVTVSGQVFDDVNDSGSFNTNDPVLSGWTVNLLNGADQVVQTARTDSSGDFSFSGVGPGTYTVAEVVQSGYNETSSPGTFSLTTTGGQDVTGLDFGNFQQWSVSGTLFEDSNQDGTLDDGETGLSGWTVNLLNGSNHVVASATTDFQGNYSLNNLPPGTYTIQEVLQPGYIPTVPGAGGVTLTPTSGAQISGEDLGVFKAVSLAVTGLTTVPSSGLQSSESLVVEWNDTNTGTSAAVGSFYDQVLITNTTTGQQLASSFVHYNAATLGDLAAGASAPEEYDFTLPNGNPGVGQIQFTVTADYDSDVSTSQGETNNMASLTETAQLASYPELAASDVSAVSTASPGQQVSVGWTLANNGAASASGPWTEQVLLATDAAGDNPTLLTAQTFSGSLPAGQSVTRSADVQLPALAPGNYWFVVSEDPFGEVFELNTSNNLAVSTEPVTIAGGLALSLSAQSVSDAAGPDATTATVTRNTATTNPLPVTITNSDPNDVTAPQTVTIPAGATSVTFPVGTIDNDVVEGAQTATLTASATGEVSGSDSLTVTDTNVPTLGVTLASNLIDETDVNPATTGTVMRNTPTAAPLVVSLLSNNINKLTVPATVTIPAGQTSATFPVSVIDDNQIDGNTTVTVTAASPGFLTGSDSAVVIDDNIPTLSLTLAQQTVSEAAGPDATTGTVAITSPASQPITIALDSSNTSAASVPATVVIDAGQESASFPIAAINNDLDIGDQTVMIAATVETNAGVFVTQGSAAANLLVENANDPALSVSFAVPAVDKGSTATGTVTRNTSDTDALVVNLASSDPTKATVPATVTIPAGQTSVSFIVTTINDHIPDGLQQVPISATALGFDTGIAPLGITDVDLPDLIVSNVTAPISGDDNTPLNISWTVTNSGLYPASGAWQDQVYLDPVGGPQSTTPADTASFTGTVNAGQSYTRTETLFFPATVGPYVVRVVTDAGQSIQELSYANNTGTSSQVNDQAAYTATVSTTVTAVSSGTPVPLFGVATFTSTGGPAADVPVAVGIMVDGTTRTLTATTDFRGDYTITFQPLQNEAGEYSVTAADPGVTNPPVQAQFAIVGMTATPASANVQVIPGTPLTGQFTLTNLSDVALTGLTATTSGGPAGLSVQLTAPSQIAGDQTATLGYSLDTTADQAANGVVTIDVTTAQGAVLAIVMEVTVLPLTPVLASNPGSLVSGMLVGSQSVVSFTVVNNGGAPSGDLQVSLPSTSYLSLASPATIPSLAPGASSTVTVELSPPANLPLEEYTGTMAVSNGQTGIAIPFNFTATTSAVGDVHVLVDDDYTFDEAGAPHVQGATVNLLNPYDNTQVVATGVTDASGAITFSNVTAGPYDLQVEATGHSTYNSSFTVVPGITNNDEVFIARQFVSYTWQVQQTTIQDTYQIQLQTEFQTDVPAPVVTITAPSALPTLQPGQSGSFNVTITNHGLIAAQGVTVNLPTDPDYTFTALTADVGVLPAESTVVVPVMVTRLTSLPQPINPGGPSLSGTLQSSQAGLNVAGLSVYAVDTTSGATFLTTTLDDGSFVFGSLPASTYTLNVDGVLLTSNSTFTVNSGQSVTSVVLTVVQGAEIDGQVLSQASNTPLLGASIQATNEATGQGFSATSDAYGNYDLSGLPAGVYDLVVNDTGFAQAEVLGVDVTQSNATETVGLTAESTIGGTIALGSGGAAETTLQVTASIAGSTDANQTYTNTSTSSSFSLIGLPAATYDVTLSMPGYATQTLSNVVVGAGQSVGLGPITLAPASEIDGTVTSTDPNTPAAGMLIQALQGSTVVGSAFADSSGNFQITNLASGTYTLAAPLSLFVTAPTVAVASGQTVTGQSVLVQPGGTIAGAVMSPAARR